MYLMLNTAKKFRLLCKSERGAPKSLFVFCLLITGLFCLTAATNTVNAATYYLDAVNGDDSNPGTSGAPWKTLSKAQSTLVEGDTALLRDGNYGSFTDKTNRTNWVYFKANTGHNPVFTAIRLGQWGSTPNVYLDFNGITVTPGHNNGADDIVWLYYVTQVRLNNMKLIGNGYSERTDTMAAVYGMHSEDVQINNCNIYGSGSSPNSGCKYGIRGVSDCNNFTVNQCDITGVAVGITLSGVNVTITDNQIYNATSDGIFFANCNNVTIADNVIHDIWLTIYLTDENGASYNNTTKTITASSGTPYSDVQTNEWVRITDSGGATDWYQVNSVIGGSQITLKTAVGEEHPNITKVEVKYGHHCDGLQSWSSPGGSNLCHNVTIQRNQIYNIEHQGILVNAFSAGIPNNWLVENNLVYGNDLGIQLSEVNDVTFRNNTFVGNDNDGYIRLHGGDLTAFTGNVVGLFGLNYQDPTFEPTNIVYENYNIIRSWGAYMIGYDAGANTRIFNNTSEFQALFNNYVGNDFTLASYSLARDFVPLSYASGTDLNSSTRDNPCDAGCYEYTASDPNNQPPVVDAIGGKSVNENALLTFTISATDADGDTITYSAQNLPSGATFSSPFSWTPGYSQAGSYQVTFIASDGSAQDSEIVTITVNNVNRAPVLAAIGNKSVNEGSLLSFSISATDADGDTITYSAQNLPSGATFSNQTFSWTPGYDQAGSFEVTFIASDGQEQDSETITITVGNTNRAPVLAAIGNKTVNENTTLNFSVSATDADGNPITYSVENLPSGAAFASQSFIWTPGYDQAGSFEVTFNASDGQDQDSETITITVSNVNRAPVLDAIADKSVDDGTLLTFAVNATDPDGDTIEYSATGLPSGAAFSGQTFSWTPAYSQADNSYQVTFIASDGQLQDSQAINIVVSDTSAPAVTNCSPAAGSIQAPLNSLIILHVTDAGEGVDNSSVTIAVDDSIVYTGNTDHYASSTGDCRRSGAESDYTFIYQSDEMLDFDQTVSVKVNAADLAGNPMPEHSYSFKTEMRSFGENKKVSSQDISKGRPGTVCDGSGNIWVAWHAGPTGSRDIYLSKLTSGAENFGAALQLTDNSVDQCNPAISLDDSDKLYVVWQDNRRGNWDIFVSTSTDGVNWSAETRVTDSNDNQINPVIVIDGRSPNRAYIAWQDDRNGNQDIYVATSQNSFVTKTISQITSDTSNQLAPAVAADASNTVYVVWTDARNASTDIYGAASDSGPWTNVAVVSNAYNQSSPAIAAESAGSVLHLLWVDDTSGDPDIYYALSDGLPVSPLNGSSIIDDTSAADQSTPAIVTTGSTGNNLRVFACWKDGRNLPGSNSDTDLYFARLNSGSGTNVLVGDDGTNSSQSEPAMATDEYGHPYLVWTDGRSINQEIYYAGSTFVAPVVLESENVTASSGATVGTEPAAINDADDVSVTVPSGACPSDVQITISRIENPRKYTLERLSLPYEFGPSGLEFDQPVTITIPYAVSDSTNTASVYWYNTLTGTLSQEGITDVETIVISPTLHALQFRTTHFTEFLIGGSIAAAVGGGGGGGGGGCSISATGQGSIAEFLVPYIGLAAAMVIIRLRDMRNRKARNIKKG